MLSLRSPLAGLRGQPAAILRGRVVSCYAGGCIRKKDLYVLSGGDCIQIGGCNMVGEVRKTRVKEVPLSEVRDDLSRYIREAERQEIVTTRRGKPAGY